MSWKKRLAIACAALTGMQLIAGFVTLYLWGFGAHVSQELATALLFGPFLTGMPIIFLVADEL